MKQLLVLFVFLSFSCGILELDHGKLEGRDGQELRATYPLVIVNSEIDIDDLEPNVWGEAALDYDRDGLIRCCEVRIERSALGSWQQRVSPSTTQVKVVDVLYFGFVLIVTACYLIFVWWEKM